MDFRHEINAFAARVAYCMGVKRTSFSEDEMLFIENSYEVGESPADCAHFVEMDRGREVARTEMVEEECE